MTINGVVWNQIPEDVKQLLSSEVGHRASKRVALNDLRPSGTMA